MWLDATPHTGQQCSHVPGEAILRDESQPRFAIVVVDPSNSSVATVPAEPDPVVGVVLPSRQSKWNESREYEASPTESVVVPPDATNGPRL